MTTFSHRTAWPDDPRTHEVSRQAFADGKPIGGAYLINGGPQSGLWHWGGLGKQGTADSLAEALESIKQAYLTASAADLEHHAYKLWVTERQRAFRGK